MSARRRVLVTGASGFLGMAIVRAARNAGYDVVNIVRKRSTSPGSKDTVMCDLSDLPLLRQTFEGAFAVIHAAGLAHVFSREAKKADQFDAINERGSDTVVNAALSVGVQKIILVSSVSVYGHDGATSGDETRPCSPRGAYALSKWRAELRSMERVGCGPASLTILRFATIYGEGDPGNIARLIVALNRGWFIWLGTGLNSKSVIYKDDAATACILALNDLRPGVNVFNVATRPATMQEIVGLICKVLGRPVPRLRVPDKLLRTLLGLWGNANRAGRLRATWQKFIRDDVYSAAKFEEEFGFQPSTSLSEGIRREVTDLHASGRL